MLVKITSNTLSSGLLWQQEENKLKISDNSINFENYANCDYNNSNKWKSFSPTMSKNNKLKK